MNGEEITDIVRHMLFVALEIAAPFLILALIVGFLISLFQALTQIHEMTLSFVPKMLVVTLALALFFPWILKILTKFTHFIYITQWQKIIDSICYVY